MFYARLSINVVNVCKVNDRASCPCVRGLLLRASAILRTCALVRYLRQRIFSRQCTICLCVVSLYARLSKLNFLTSSSKACVVAIGTSSTIASFPPFGRFLFLCGRLSSSKGALVVVLNVSRWDAMLTVSPVPLARRLFGGLSRATLGRSYP